MPTVIRWPGTIRPGTVYNEMFSHYDLIPTFAAAGGDPDIVDKCLRGAQIGNKTFKVHLDGFNLIPFFKGEAKEAPRKEFVYWNDDGQLVAIRVNEWKSVFLEQNNKGIGVWSGQFTDLRIPKRFQPRAGSSATILRWVNFRPGPCRHPRHSAGLAQRRVFVPRLNSPSRQSARRRGRPRLNTARIAAR